MNMNNDEWEVPELLLFGFAAAFLAVLAALGVIKAVMWLAS